MIQSEEQGAVYMRDSLVLMFSLKPNLVKQDLRTR